MEKQQPGTCLLCKLGRIAYPEAEELQKRLLDKRYDNKIGDILLLLEHPPTVTLGKFARPENILIPPDMLAEKGVSVYPSSRGGDVTFHCPGQLVVHPILDLRQRPGVLRGYITDLEEVMLKVLRYYGIDAERWEEHPGIWVEGRQIGAIGLHFSHGISMHGFSLNVNPDLKSFEVINLCGLPGKIAASISGELGRDIPVNEVEQRVIESFADVFHVRMEQVEREQLKEDDIDTETA
jgi:lipoate-protein ligase B